jgi:hypothetical protein
LTELLLLEYGDCQFVSWNFHVFFIQLFDLW